MYNKIKGSILNDGLTYKKIWGVAFPIMIGGLADNINSAINTAFVGHLGEVAIDSVGLGGLFYFNFAIIGLGMAAGVQIITGRRNGEEQYEEAGTVVNNSLLMFLLMGLAVLGITYFSGNYLLDHIIRDSRIAQASKEYMAVRQFGLPLIFVTFCLRSFFIGITKTKVLTAVTLTSAFINILLDYVLIFGHFGFPKLGIMGAAYSSIIAEAVALLVYIIITQYWKELKPFMLFRFRELKLSIMLQVAKIGSPLMLQGWVSFSSWLLFFALIEKMGARELAVSTILKSLYLLYLIPMYGFAAAANSLTSNLIGEGAKHEVIPLLKRIVLMSTGIMSVLVLIIFAFPGPVVSLFNSNPEIIEAAIGPLRVVACALMLFPAGIVMFNGVSGTGDTRASLVIEVITIFFYIGYIVLAANVFKAPIVIVWMAEIVYMLFMGLGSYFRLASGKWKNAQV